MEGRLSAFYLMLKESLDDPSVEEAYKRAVETFMEVMLPKPLYVEVITDCYGSENAEKDFAKLLAADNVLTDHYVELLRFVRSKIPEDPFDETIKKLADEE